MKNSDTEIQIPKFNFPSNKEILSYSNPNRKTNSYNEDTDLSDYNTAFRNFIKDSIFKDLNILKLEESRAEACLSNDQDFISKIELQLQYLLLLERALEKFSEDERFILCLKYQVGISNPKNIKAAKAILSNDMIEAKSASFKKFLSYVPYGSLAVKLNDARFASVSQTSLTSELKQFLTAADQEYNILPMILFNVFYPYFRGKKYKNYTDAAMSILGVDITYGYLGDIAEKVLDLVKIDFEDIYKDIINSVSEGDKATAQKLEEKIEDTSINEQIIEGSEELGSSDFMNIEIKMKLASFLLDFFAYRLGNNSKIRINIAKEVYNKTITKKEFYPNIRCFYSFTFWAGLIRYLAYPWDASFCNSTKFEEKIESNSNLIIELERMRMKDLLFSSSSFTHDPRVEYTDNAKNSWENLRKHFPSISEKQEGGSLDYYCSVLGFFKTSASDNSIGKYWNQKVKTIEKQTQTSKQIKAYFTNSNPSLEALSTLHESVKEAVNNYRNSTLPDNETSTEEQSPPPKAPLDSDTSIKMQKNEQTRANEALNKLTNENTVAQIKTYTKYISYMLKNLINSISGVDGYINYHKTKKKSLIGSLRHSESGIKRANFFVNRIDIISNNVPINIGASLFDRASMSKQDIAELNSRSEQLIIKEVLHFMIKFDYYKDFSGSINFNDHSCATYILRALFKTGKELKNKKTFFAGYVTDILNYIINLNINSSSDRKKMAKYIILHADN